MEDPLKFQGKQNGLQARRKNEKGFRENRCKSGTAQRTEGRLQRSKRRKQRECTVQS